MIDLLRWIGETSFAVGVLIVVILIIRRPFAKAFGARAAYALWLAPVLRIFLPELAILPSPDAIIPNEFLWAAEALPAGAEASALASGFDLRTFAAVFALFIWFTVGFAWFSLKIEAQTRFMSAMLASSKPAPNEIMLVANAIRRALGVKQTIRLRICDKDYGPSVIGLFRPVIFLPENFLIGYSAEERRLALAHEIAHIARGDMAATLAALAFQAAQWPNPLVHFAFRLFRTDQEAACDAFVLTRYREDASAAGDYASAILKSATGADPSPAFGLSLGHPVKERLMLLKKQKQSPLRRIVGGGGAIALVLGGLAATASYGYAAHDAKEDGEVRKDKRVIIMGGDGDFDFTTSMMHGGDFEFITEDGVHQAFKMMTAKGGHGAHMRMMGTGNCSAEGGDGEPVKLEWSSDEGKDGDVASHTIICLTGDEAADPKKRAEALRKAIDHMEAQAKKEAEQRKKMIASLRKQLREIEKKK